MAPANVSSALPDPWQGKLTKANLSAVNDADMRDSRHRISHWTNGIPADVGSITTNDKSKEVGRYRTLPSILARNCPTKNAVDRAAGQAGFRKRDASSICGHDDVHESASSPKRRAVRPRSGYDRRSVRSSTTHTQASLSADEEETKDADAEGLEDCSSHDVALPDPFCPRTKGPNHEALAGLFLEDLGLPAATAPKAKAFLERAVTMDPLTAVDFHGTYTTLYDWESDPEWNYVYARFFQPWFWETDKLALTTKLRTRRIAEQKKAADMSANKRA